MRLAADHEQGPLWPSNHLPRCDTLLLTTADAPDHLAAHLKIHQIILTCPEKLKTSHATWQKPISILVVIRSMLLCRTKC